MDIRIGIAESPRELSIESSQTSAEVQQAVEAALAGSTPTLSLSDAKGNLFLVPSASITYVEIGSEESRRVGFVM